MLDNDVFTGSIFATKHSVESSENALIFTLRFSMGPFELAEVLNKDPL